LLLLNFLLFYYEVNPRKMDLTQEYSINEIYMGIQGEAGWAGTAMAFVRLAGCNVGTPWSPEAQKAMGIPTWRQRCTNWDGISFACDIDYHKQKVKSVEKIMATPEVSNAHRVCITGGEPFLHDLVPLVKALSHEKKKVHVETAGTFSVRRVMRYEPWITCSPKHGYLLDVLAAANEIKILVGKEFDENRFLYEFQAWIHTGKIWFQPIDGQSDDDNTKKCLALVEKYPGTRISVQLHKILGWR
jgi:7-carboxy-7-deazaguanine synthase